jgi:hypothetical protein
VDAHIVLRLEHAACDRVLDVARLEGEVGRLTSDLAKVASIVS